MFLRFSDQEKINVYPPSATNSAGTYRLQDGSKIMGGIVAKENILIWTDNALYSMKFVGAPYTFGFEQVGTNCGLIGQNAVVEIDGVAYWIGNNGFFSFDGTVNNLPCSVEDYVFDDFDTTKGQQVAMQELIICLPKLFGIIQHKAPLIMIDTLCIIMVSLKSFLWVIGI